MKHRTSLTKKNSKSPSEITVALLGNPNVGKSTFFNQLTGMRQHTGNWTGKTVGCTEGACYHNGTKINLIDLPGTYSLIPHSAEEEITSEYITSKKADLVAIICDATCLERNLILALSVLEYCEKAVICLNLMDEAEKKGITINCDQLESRLGVKVIAMSATKKKGINDALDAILSASKREIVLSSENSRQSYSEFAEKIANEVIKKEPSKREAIERKTDSILCGKLTAFPTMLLLLSLIFWITIVGANYPSELLLRFFVFLGHKLSELLSYLGIYPWLSSLIVNGIWKTLSRVIAVMLPPMAIFFPLFTLLEDLGYLPRVAFNLDRCFKKCDACGKQALTMCMGFGCNAVGVVGCRIIDSKRERLIAMLTNVFVPCNGRFPTIIALISIFFITSTGIFGGILSALALSAVIVLGFVLTFAVSKLLSITLLKGSPSSFTLELPPYRKPQVLKVILRSIIDRTLIILGRAVAVAAPAGLIIWLFANIEVSSKSLLLYCTESLDHFASFFGIDGVILFAFILALPANEIVIPVILMAYSSAGSLVDYTSLSELGYLLRANGWTKVTAICVIIFMLCHFPCSTTLITIKKESGKLSWALLAAVLPTVVGLILCFIVSNMAKLF